MVSVILFGSLSEDDVLFLDFSFVRVSRLLIYIFYSKICKTSMWQNAKNLANGLKNSPNIYFLPWF